MNVLKPHLRITIATLLGGGAAQREIARRTGVDRKTIRRYVQAANSPGVAPGFFVPPGQAPPPRPPAVAGLGLGTTQASAGSMRFTPSACEPHRVWIEAQVQLGRNAVSIYRVLLHAD